MFNSENAVFPGPCLADALSFTDSSLTVNITDGHWLFYEDGRKTNKARGQLLHNI